MAIRFWQINQEIWLKNNLIRIYAQYYKNKADGIMEDDGRKFTGIKE
jgi:hypothetical protein